MRTTFKTHINFNGDQLRVTVPETLRNRTFEAFYANGTLMISEAAAGKGVKVSSAKIGEKTYCNMLFGGKKWLGEKVPKFKFSTDVIYENGQFVVKVPEQQNAPQTTTVEKPVETSARKVDTVTVSLNTCNKFAKENGYIWRVSADGQTAYLTKEERIG